VQNPIRFERKANGEICHFLHAMTNIKNQYPSLFIVHKCVQLFNYHKTTINKRGSDIPLAESIITLFGFTVWIPGLSKHTQIRPFFDCENRSSQLKYFLPIFHKQKSFLKTNHITFLTSP
jgi:hypothetical protein